MAYSIALYERLSELLPGHRYPVKRMFGGVVFFLRGHMLVGTFGRGMMVRVSAQDGAEYLKYAGAVPLAGNPKRMQGFLILDESLIDRDDDLELWIARAMAYNTTLVAKER